MTGEKLLSFALPDSLAQVLMYAFIASVIFLFIKNKGKWKIGPIEYEPAIDKKLYKEFSDFALKSERCDKDILEQVKNSIEDRKEMREQLLDISAEMKLQKEDLTRLRRESLKTQILLSETSYERKLYLYDAYKKLNGNGWLAEWIESYKEEHKGEV